MQLRRLEEFVSPARSSCAISCIAISCQCKGYPISRKSRFGYRCLQAAMRGIVGAASSHFRSDRDPLLRIRLKTASEIELTTARAGVSRHVRVSCMTNELVGTPVTSRAYALTNVVPPEPATINRAPCEHPHLQTGRPPASQGITGEARTPPRAAAPLPRAV